MTWTKEEHEAAKRETERNYMLPLVTQREMLAEIERGWAEIETLQFNLRAINDSASRASTRLLRAFDGANKLYQAASALVSATEGPELNGPAWAHVHEARERLRAAIDPAEIEACAKEATRRDGLEALLSTANETGAMLARQSDVQRAEIERLTATITQANNALFDVAPNAEDAEHLIKCHADKLPEAYRRLTKGAAEAWRILSAKVVNMVDPAPCANKLHQEAARRDEPEGELARVLAHIATLPPWCAPTPPPGMRLAVLGGECARCLAQPGYHEGSCVRRMAHSGPSEAQHGWILAAAWARLAQARGTVMQELDEDHAETAKARQWLESVGGDVSANPPVVIPESLRATRVDSPCNADRSVDHESYEQGRAECLADTVDWIECVVYPNGGKRCDRLVTRLQDRERSLAANRAKLRPDRAPAAVSACCARAETAERQLAELHSDIEALRARLQAK